jgi:hypothetical protein
MSQVGFLGRRVGTADAVPALFLRSAVSALFLRCSCAQLVLRSSVLTVLISMR